MTQALNLANFANNLNTGGATTNAGLQNSSVTVTAGTGMSGGGAVALGSSVTLTNAGVTSIVAGTNITISGATGAVTVNASGASAPSFNSVGSYCSIVGYTANFTSGSNYSAGSGTAQVRSVCGRNSASAYNYVTNNLSGTWKWMGATVNDDNGGGDWYTVIGVRVS
jgi:hypothetical protein